MEQTVPYSRVLLCGSGAANCGYCKSKDSAYSFGLIAKRLNCEIYQQFIDNGWRRSGTYLYKPDLEKSCCPLYSIRLDSNSFKPNKTQRKVISKFNKVVLGVQGKKADPEADWSSLLAKAESGTDFKIVLEKSAFTEEVFELYKKYQTTVHKDPEEDVKPESFRRFLVETPLKYEFLDKNKGLELGSFHQKYYYKEKLIAVGVIDILPRCVSSVYFMYDVEFRQLSLGKYSAMVEARLSIKYSLPFYYLGYYIHTCPKMEYKASYQPSYLLDPVSYNWFPFSDFVKLIDMSLKNNSNGFATFDQVDSEISQKEPSQIYKNHIRTSKDYNEMMALLYDNLYSLGDLCDSLENKHPDIVACLKQCFDLLGPTVASQIILEIS